MNQEFLLKTINTLNFAIHIKILWWPSDDYKYLSFTSLLVLVEHICIAYPWFQTLTHLIGLNIFYWDVLCIPKQLPQPITLILVEVTRFSRFSSIESALFSKKDKRVIFLKVLFQERLYKGQSVPQPSNGHDMAPSI